MEKTVLGLGHVTVALTYWSESKEPLHVYMASPELLINLSRYNQQQLMRLPVSSLNKAVIARKGYTLILS